MSRWLTWRPDQVFRKASEDEPTKPTKPNFDGSVGSTSGHFQKIEAVPSEKEGFASAQTKSEEAGLDGSVRRLEATRVLLAISEDGDLRVIYNEDARHQAVLDGFTVYTPRDAYYFVQLDKHSRRMLYEFKRRFGGTTEWREDV